MYHCLWIYHETWPDCLNLIGDRHLSRAMRPPWVLGASSIQRRILRTVLERLTLFSALELEDIALTWGSRSTVVLQNVLLNTANFNVPFVDITLAKATTLVLHVPSNPLRDFLKVEVNGLEIHANPTDISLGKSVIQEEDVEEIGVTDFTSILYSTFGAVFNSMKVTILNMRVYFLGLTVEVRQIEYEPGLFTLSDITANPRSMVVNSLTKSSSDFSSDSEDDLEQSTMFTSALASSLYESAMSPPLFSLVELKVRGSFPFESIDIQCSDLNLFWSTKIDMLLNFLKSIVDLASTTPPVPGKTKFSYKVSGNRACLAHENFSNRSFVIGRFSLASDCIEMAKGRLKADGVDWTFESLEVKKSQSDWTIVLSSGLVQIGSSRIYINPLETAQTNSHLIISLSPLVFSPNANTLLATFTNIKFGSWGSIRDAVVTIIDGDLGDPSVSVDIYAGKKVTITISDIDLRLQRQDIECIRRIATDVKQLISLLPNGTKQKSSTFSSPVHAFDVQTITIRAADIRAKFLQLHINLMTKFLFNVSSLDLYFRGKPAILSRAKDAITATFAFNPLHLNLAISEVSFDYWPELLRLVPSSGNQTSFFKGHVQVAVKSVVCTLTARNPGKLRLLLDDCGFYLTGSSEKARVVGEIEIRKVRTQLLLGNDVADLARLSSMHVDLHVGESGSHISIIDAFLIIESCADSTKLAQSVVSGLLPETKKPAMNVKYKLDRSSTKDIFDKIDDNAFHSRKSKDVHVEDNSFEILGKSEPLSEESSILELSDDIVLAESLVDLATSKLHSPSIHISGSKINVLWNLHDGFDWSPTREIIEATIRKQEQTNDNVGDFLFNSIYIEIPKVDPIKMASKSFTTTRSEQHKVQIDGSDISMEFFLYPSGLSEVVSSGTLQVGNLEIIDNVPTSTWKKFTTYDSTYPRRYQSAMVILELLNVLPVATLLASEGILKVKVLPLRLHVDQDTLDFLVRFFEFDDENSKASSDGLFFRE